MSKGLYSWLMFQGAFKNGFQIVCLEDWVIIQEAAVLTPILAAVMVDIN